MPQKLSLENPLKQWKTVEGFLCSMQGDGDALLSSFALLAGYVANRMEELSKSPQPEARRELEGFARTADHLAGVLGFIADAPEIISEQTTKELSDEDRAMCRAAAGALEIAASLTRSAVKVKRLAA